MYIKRIEIENIRSIQKFVWEQPENNLAGWHVLIGDNGSGKSTVLKAISLALLGERNVYALRESPEDWVRHNKGSAHVSLEIYETDLETNGQLPLLALPVEHPNFSIGIDPDGHLTDFYFNSVTPSIERYFSVAFGPYRRFEGLASRNYKDIKRGNSRLTAHLSLFDEGFALTEVTEWLKQLNYKRLEGREVGTLLEPIRTFINQTGLLPHQVQLEMISSEEILFRDANGTRVSLESLSDGYRSVLSMTFEIIRQLVQYKPDRNIFSRDATQITASGVVLIDEVDAHLHPSWQREIGRQLMRIFPKMQFIVTTHSPLVCQAAIRGSIWRLPNPGSGENAYPIEPGSEAWKRLVYGNVLEAYSTDLFGEDIDRSPEAQAKYERIAELSVKELDEPLTNAEATELQRLLSELPATPYKRIAAADHD